MCIVSYHPLSLSLPLSLFFFLRSDLLPIKVIRTGCTCLASIHGRGCPCPSQTKYNIFTYLILLTPSHTWSIPKVEGQTPASSIIYSRLDNYGASTTTGTSFQAPKFVVSGDAFEAPTIFFICFLFLRSTIVVKTHIKATSSFNVHFT